MKEYFKYFGEVTDCSLMRDRESGKSRGFGFVTFKDPAAVEKVLAQKSHILDGKTVDCKEAVPKSADPNDPSKLAGNFRTKKIFVGGLPHELTETEFVEYFTKYGVVTHSQIMKDRESGKPRGFGFITFDSEDSVEKVLENMKEHKLMGKWVECKKATPTTTSTKNPTSGAVPTNGVSPMKPKMNVGMRPMQFPGYPLNPAGMGSYYNGAMHMPRYPPPAQPYPPYMNEYYNPIPYYEPNLMRPYPDNSPPYTPDTDYAYNYNYPKAASVPEEYKLPLYPSNSSMPSYSSYDTPNNHSDNLSPYSVFPQGNEVPNDHSFHNLGTSKSTGAPSIDYARSFAHPSAYSGFFTESDSSNVSNQNLTNGFKLNSTPVKIQEPEIKEIPFMMPNSKDEKESKNEEEVDEDLDSMSIFEKHLIKKN